MTKLDSSLSPAQQDLLKAFKKQINQPVPNAPTATAERHEPKPVLAKASDEPDEQQLFKHAMQGVQPLPQAQDLAPPEQLKKPRVYKMDAQTLARRAAAEGLPEQEHAALSDTQAILNPVASEASLSYRIATLQHKVFDELKTGKMRWFEAVDLHGCTVEQARTAVLQIIDMTKAAQHNVLKIVHGKGPDSILKSYVNGWLRQHPDVIAFVSAPDKQGGTGAVLVLIKRTAKRQNESAAT